MENENSKTQAAIDQLGAMVRDFGEQITISKGEALVLMQMAELGMDYMVYETVRRNGQNPSNAKIQDVQDGYHRTIGEYSNRFGKNEAVVAAAVIAATAGVLQSVDERVFPDSPT